MYDGVCLTAFYKCAVWASVIFFHKCTLLLHVNTGSSSETGIFLKLLKVSVIIITIYLKKRNLN